MTQTVILYGCSLAYPVVKYEEDGNYPFLQHNRMVLQSLPSPDDDTLPRFTRGLFTLTSVDPFMPGFYKVPVIHFGGSFRNLDGYWHEWLLKFEGLLSNLYWKEAYLHLMLEWPPEGFSERNYHYRWVADGHPILEEQLPPREWEFSGGPRDFSSP